MNGTCHLTFGTAVGISAVLNLEALASVLPNITVSAETGTLIILGSIIGSVLPDIDNPQSYVGKLCFPISRVFGKIHDFQHKEAWEHRGIMHYTEVWIAGLMLSYLHFMPLIGLFLGGLTHLFLDSFNPMGIPFLLGVKRLRLGKIKSGDKGAVIFTGMCTAVILIAGIALYFYGQK